MELSYYGGGLVKVGKVTLFLDGQKCGEGRVDTTQPMIFSANEATGVGGDRARPVSDDTIPPNELDK